MAETWQIHPDGPQRPLPALLGDVKELIIEEMYRRLPELGHAELRPGQCAVIRFMTPEGVRLTELAEKIGLTKQAVGEVVSDLERMGYVKRAPDPLDGRAKIIQLTDLGWSGAEAAQEIFADVERAWTEQLGEERIRGLRATLEAVLALERGATRAA